MPVKRKIWRILVLMAIITALLIPAATAGTDTAVNVKSAVDSTVNYLLAQEKTQGRPLSPWSYVALAGAGQDLANSMVLKSCEQQFDSLQSGELNNYSLLVLTLVAAGSNPYDYRGQNLVQKISAAQLSDGKFADNIDRSGTGDKDEQVLLNAHVWAVLALHAAGAEVPDPAKAKQWLHDRQHQDGSFYWYTGEEKSDVDSTGMALTALGFLGENKNSPAVQKAAAYLRSVQENNGGFASWGASNPESCRFVIEGLTAVGIDTAGTDWTKNGGNPVSALMSYQLPDGSFEHVRGAGSNAMSTEQALLGLSDYYYGNTVIERLRKKNHLATVISGSAQSKRIIRFKLGETQYEVISDGQKQVLDADAAPFLQNGRTFVPLRHLALALGVPEQGIDWTPATQTVKLASNGVTVTLAVGDNILYVNDRPLQMDVAPLLIPPGRTCLPARYVAEVFGYMVRWNEVEQSVVISRL